MAGPAPCHRPAGSCLQLDAWYEACCASQMLGPKLRNLISDLCMWQTP